MRILLGILALVLIVVLIMPDTRTAEQKAADEEKETIYNAKYTCQSFVEDRLKAPATAKFQRTGDTKAIKQSGVQYFVSGYVDAQNGFGALIRTNYACTMQLAGGKWILVDIEI